MTKAETLAFRKQHLENELTDTIGLLLMTQGLFLECPEWEAVHQGLSGLNVAVQKLHALRVLVQMQ